MKKSHCFVGALFLGFLASCGGVSKNENVSTQSSDYNYCFSVNCPEAMSSSCGATCSSGCTTQVQHLTSLDAECSALQNYTLNGGCAYSARQDYFAQLGCPGTFSEH